MKKIFSAAVMLCVLCALLCGCSVPHEYFNSVDGDFNRNLFYRNDLEVRAADPSVIYADDADGKGWFYMYATSDDIGASGYMCWKSRDLSDWQTTGVAFIPDRNSWGVRNYWAPEVIERDGKYLMYYNAMNSYEGNRHCLGLAVSDSPEGPFVQWTGENADGDVITVRDPIVDFSKLGDDHPERDMAAIDASPFIDDDGNMYLYFVRDLSDNVKKSTVWGLRMKDEHTPDYSTLTQLTETGKRTVGGDEDALGEGNVNEAPFMTKHDGKYYLTFSVNSYWEKSYSVSQAIGETPLGQFEKQGLVLEAEPTYNHASGTGHHSFVSVGGEMFIVYHAHIDRAIGGGDRAIAFDRAEFVTREDGVTVIHANGPTWSVQPLPKIASGYGNVAKNAVCEISGVAAPSLVNGLVKIHEYDTETETDVPNGGEITVTFDREYTVRAVLVYHTYDINRSYDAGLTVTVGKSSVKRLPFSTSDYTDRLGELVTGSAAVIELGEVNADKVSIIIDGDAVVISEIVVLGKEA